MRHLLQRSLCITALSFFTISGSALADAGPDSGDAAADVASPVADAPKEEAKPDPAPAAADADNSKDAGAAKEDGEGKEDADAVIDPGKDPEGFMKMSYEKIKNGDWWPVASLIVIGLVWLLRKAAKSKSKWWGPVPKWLASDAGGVILAVALPVLLGIAHEVLATGSAPDWATLQAALKITAGAIAVYVAPKKVLPKGSFTPPSGA